MYGFPDSEGQRYILENDLDDNIITAEAISGFRVRSRKFVPAQTRVMVNPTFSSLKVRLFIFTWSE